METAKVTTVLVVEDEAIIASDIQEVLRRLGYVVPCTAATGEAAIRAATELKPNLVLMDIQLRGPMDGVEAASAIREAIDVPVVFLTSFSDDRTLARAKGATPSGYLLKPFTDRTLRTTLEVALHKHALESKLAERDVLLATTLEVIAEGVIVTDADGRITLMNPAAVALTGWPLAEAQGKALSDVFRLVEAAGSVGPGDTGSARHDAAANAGALLASRSAGTIPVDHNAAPIIGLRGARFGAVLAFRNATARQALEHRVVMSERLASLGTVAAGMVHEINNPITYITANDMFAAERIGALLDEVALSDSSMPPDCPLSKKWVAELVEARDALRESSDGARRVREIIESVGRFTRVEAAGTTRLALVSSIEQAVKMAASHLPPHIALVRDFRSAPMAVANETQLTEVFVNLLVNAAHALASSPVPLPAITVSTYTDGEGRAVAEVRDNGCGMDEATRARIFEPFFTTKPIGSGSGLGLYLAHAIVQGVGGSLGVESEHGVGTTFRIVLPPAS